MIPIPPSSNNQYWLRHDKRKGKTYHIASDELESFRKEMSIYHARYPEIMVPAFKTMREWKEAGLPLHFAAFFYFTRTRVYCLDGSPKRMDVSNRLKALHDEVAKLFSIDDSCFFSIEAFKLVTRNLLPEQVIVCLSPALQDQKGPLNG